MKPLSNRQKSCLAQAARRAFDNLVAKGQLTGIDFDTWRRDEVERAVGRAGLRQCDNSHYNRLLAHFEALAGEDGRAMNALVREQTDSKRQAEVVLLRELSKAGLPLSYAEAIARDKFHRAVCEIDARQAWQLVYTVKSRIRSKARALKAESNPCPSVSIRGSELGTRNPEPGTAVQIVNRKS